MTAESVVAMVALGVDFGRSFGGGEVIGLCGDLGAGKTHLAKGIAEGLGSGEAVSSPTFSLVQEYGDGRLRMAHFDFYRVGSADELLELGWDEYLEDCGVVVVEWADRFPGLMPPATRWLRIEVRDDGVREVLEVAAPLVE
ncbi:MAG: tRNA (adenosine(37)-N6)-threonylcarbamoyltransferase complex ATPase subunit type 1 TsaE [Verrucomicrobiales bacterium]|nr:tRNA (adenosine(37)-N6)-threonylcarbamoyltransferase complex ATPase subunit type 1 TsaE [Verrucomicrobiales bacterium]